MGASLSEETVRNMRGILDQICAVDSRSVYDSHDEHTYADERTYTDECTYADERTYGTVAGGRELDRSHMGGNGDRQYQRVQGIVGQHSGDRRNNEEMSHRTSNTHYNEMHGDEGGHYENTGVPALDYQRRLISAEREINVLNSTLQSERRVTDALTAQLSDLMNSDTFSPIGEEGEGTGFRGGNIGVVGLGVGGRVEDPQGERDVTQLPSNTAHRTYSSFMRETEMEYTLPDGEGMFRWWLCSWR